MAKDKKILMIAAENDSLPGAKVGGVGDVLRDLPRALIKEGAEAYCAIPSYGFLSRLKGLESLGYVKVTFAHQPSAAEILLLKGGEGECDHYIIHHPMFYKKGEAVYYHDDHEHPFASDATKFAFFSAAIAEALVQGVIPRPDFLHLHDWHAAFLLILIRFGAQYISLRDIPSIYTIHNLAMQGVRPFDGDESSFNRWFPDLHYSLDKISDPRYPDCVNPMRAGVLLADKVHTVSPTYAKEILRESHYELGIYGGDGLENDLRERTDKGEVFGILNGCEYPDSLAAAKGLKKAEVVALMQDSVIAWVAKHHLLPTAHWLAEKSIASFNARKSLGLVVTSVGRMTEQKARLLHTQLEDGRTVLQALLDSLGDKGTLIVLGSGDRQLEKFIFETAARNSNMIFLNGYSDAMSHALYNFGHLFLMPSSFEPCGISQMLAMRAGQPCLVNGVGGLKDTVKHFETGFVFNGETAKEQSEALVDMFANVVSLYFDHQEKWQAIGKAAAQQRFTWEQAADDYIDVLYR